MLLQDFLLLSLSSLRRSALKVSFSLSRKGYRGMTVSPPSPSPIFKVLCWNFPLMLSRIPNYELSSQMFLFSKRKSYFSVLHFKLGNAKAFHFSKVEEKGLIGWPEQASDSLWLVGSKFLIRPSTSVSCEYKPPGLKVGILGPLPGLIAFPRDLDFCGYMAMVSLQYS